MNMSSPNQTADLAALHAQLSGLSIGESASQTPLDSYSIVQPMQPSIFRQMYKLWAGQHSIVLKRDIPRMVEGYKFNSARLHTAVLLYRITNNCSVIEITLDGWMAIGDSIGWNSSNAATTGQPPQFPCEPQAAARLAELYHQFLDQFDSLYLSGAFRNDLTEIPIGTIMGTLGSRPAKTMSAQDMPEANSFDNVPIMILAQFHKKYANWASTSHIVYIWRLMIIDGTLLDLYTLYIEASKISRRKLYCSGPHDGWFHWTVLGGRLGYGSTDQEAPGEGPRSSQAIGLQLMTAYSEYIAGFILKCSLASWLLSKDDSPPPLPFISPPCNLNGPDFAASCAILGAFQDMNLSTD